MKISKVTAFFQWVNVSRHISRNVDHISHIDVFAIESLPQNTYVENGITHSGLIKSWSVNLDRPLKRFLKFLFGRTGLYS